MFDSLKNLGAMASIMKDLPRIKARMGEVKEKSAAMRVAASSGGGIVTVVASGRMRIESITLDPSVATALATGDAENRALAAELVREATNAALEKAQLAVAQMLGEAAQEFNLPLAPEDLARLM